MQASGRYDRLEEKWFQGCVIASSGPKFLPTIGTDRFPGFARSETIEVGERFEPWVTSESVGFGKPAACASFLSPPSFVTIRVGLEETLRFNELVRLLEENGFRLIREKGSGRYYAKAGVDRLNSVDFMEPKKSRRELAMLF